MPFSDIKYRRYGRTGPAGPVREWCGKMENLAGKVVNIRFRMKGPRALYGQNVGDFPKHHFTYLVSEVLPENQALQVRFSGLDESVRGVWRRRENSDLFSLEFVQKGQYEFRQNGVCYNCGPGDLFLVQIGGDSCMRTISEYSLKKTISIAGTSLVSILNSLNLAQVDVIRNVPEHVNGIFDRIFLLMEERPENYLHELSIQSFRLLLELSERSDTRGCPELLNRMIRYIGEQFDRGMTIDQLSRKFGVSSGTVFRLFREYLGTSPMDYVIHLRMKHARCLLLEQQSSIKSIADRVGYRNQLYFSSEFRRIYGMSPRDFRKKNTSY